MVSFTKNIFILETGIELFLILFLIACAAFIAYLLGAKKPFYDYVFTFILSLAIALPTREYEIGVIPAVLMSFVLVKVFKVITTGVDLL